MSAPGAKKPAPAPFSKAQLAGEALTLAVGCAGAGLFMLLHIPGGAMSGSVVAVALLSVFGRATPIGGPLRVLGMASEISPGRGSWTNGRTGRYRRRAAEAAQARRKKPALRLVRAAPMFG